MLAQSPNQCVSLSATCVCACVSVCTLNALPKEEWFCPNSPQVGVAMVAVDTVCVWVGAGV